MDQECSLCAQNPHRRCEGNFSGKYLAGDVLKAKCGASIRVEVVDRATAESVTSSDALADIRLEVRKAVLRGLGNEPCFDLLLASEQKAPIFVSL